MFIMKLKDLHPSFNTQSPAKALPLSEAMDVFDWLADMQDIAFNYQKNGCAARAHIMCQRLIARGMPAFKAWGFEENALLEMTGPDGRTFQWNYHVAAALPVRISDTRGGYAVLDPSIFDGPVALRDWAATIGCPDPFNHIIVPFGFAPKRGAGGNYTPTSNATSKTDDKAGQMMFQYLKFQPSGPRRLYPSPLRDAYCAQTGAPRVCEGKTWISEPEYQRRMARAQSPQENATWKM